jgi:hypothetical protein
MRADLSLDDGWLVSLLLGQHIIWFVVWILSQDDKVLNHIGLWNELLRGKFSPLNATNEDWGVMSLETSDLFGLSCLTHSVHCISNSHLSLHWLELLVQSDQHSGVDRQSQVE